MDNTSIQRKFESVSLHLGIGDGARQQVAQQLQSLQQDFAQLKARVEHAEREVYNLNMENQGLRRALDEAGGRGIQEMEMEESEVKEGMTQQPYGTQQHHGTQQHYGTQQRYGVQQYYGAQQQYGIQQYYGAQQQYAPTQGQPAHPCKRCELLDDGAFSEARRLQRQLDSRVPICTFCWALSRNCDDGAQCQTCVDEGRRCKRKLCDGREYCRKPGCPRLHPSQYNDGEDWDVDEGRMPVMGIKPEDPEDHYP